MEESKILKAVKTEYPPCCLQLYDSKFVIVGTYELRKESGHRVGSVDVFDEELNLLNRYYTYGAILDLKLSPTDATLVATAHSTGNVQLWKIVVENDTLSLQEISNLQVFGADTLITSLHFSPIKPSTLLLTATTGETVTIDIEYDDIVFSTNNVLSAYRNKPKIDINVQGNNQKCMESMKESFNELHSLECWTAEFGKMHPFDDVIFTGGDDATIMAHDLRTKEIIWSNNRIHEAGVVAIKTSSSTFNFDKPTSLITGSYDDYIRTFDLRMLGDNIFPGSNLPVMNTQKVNLGGGVWRFSENPEKDKNLSDKLLVCCMYDGAKIVEGRNDRNEFFAVTNYLTTGHESMCYGGQWGKNFIATCSFYDKSLQLWNP